MNSPSIDAHASCAGTIAQSHAAVVARETEWPPLATQTLFLTGPTASGKTGLGVAIAERLGAEIVSMDSMALYRRMDMGTSKPSLADRQRVPHHLVDVLEPWEEFSLGQYLEAAHRMVEVVYSRKRQVLFVGGTPLYLKALVCGANTGPPPDTALRARLEHEAAVHGCAWLHRRLAEVDPIAAGRISPHDLRRIVRALEVYEKTGLPISANQVHFRRPSGPAPRVYAIDMSRDALYCRINRRVEEMFGAGLVDEVAELLKLEHPLSRTARQALGYKEVIEHLEGRRPLDSTVELVQRRSRQFAKRQLTWLRSFSECRWLRLDSANDLDKFVAAIR